MNTWGLEGLLSPDVVHQDTHIRIARVMWVDPGRVPGDHQSHSSLLSQAGDRKYNKRLVGQDKGGERSLTDYCHGLNRLHLGKLIHYQTNQSRIKRNKTKS